MSHRRSTAVPPPYVPREDADSTSASESAANSISGLLRRHSLSSDSDSNSELYLCEPFLFQLKPDLLIKDMLLCFKSATAVSLSELNLETPIWKNVNPSESEMGLGLVVGRLKFSVEGVMIDCSKFVMSTPTNGNRVGDMHSDALFVLLVENDDAFRRLSENKFYDRFPSIIMTAKGQLDLSTMMFLWKMKMELKLPILALLDSDPLGVHILSVYGRSIPGIKWLGFRPSDLNKYKIPKGCRLLMEEEDIQAGMDLLKDDFVKKNPGWVDELRLMVQSKEKAEIQALCSHGVQYLTDVYLPMKLQHKDWL